MAYLYNALRFNEPVISLKHPADHMNFHSGPVDTCVPQDSNPGWWRAGMTLRMGSLGFQRKQRILSYIVLLKPSSMPIFCHHLFLWEGHFLHHRPKANNKIHLHQWQLFTCTMHIKCSLQAWLTIKRLCLSHVFG